MLGNNIGKFNNFSKFKYGTLCYDLLCYHYHNHYHPTLVASCPVSSPHAKCQVCLSVVVTIDPMDIPKPVAASEHWEVQHAIVLHLFV
jgi:hypothetical protein